VVVADGAVRAVASDPPGAALLRIAERLTQGLPGKMLMLRERACDWCGKVYPYERKTSKFHDENCRRAARRARQQPQQEGTQ
jgi:hypothetical protein